MAVTISFTVTNAEGALVADAVGYATRKTDPGTGQLAPATQAEVKDYIIQHVRTLVRNYQVDRGRSDAVAALPDPGYIEPT